MIKIAKPLRWILAPGIGLGFGCSLFGQAPPYVAPDFAQPLVPKVRSELGSVARDELSRALLDVVDHPAVDGFTRGKALALAFALGSHQEVIGKDFDLRHGTGIHIQPARMPPRAQISSGLRLHLESLKDSEIAPYLRDVLVEITGETITSTPPNWSRIFPDGAQLVPRPAAGARSGSSGIAGSSEPIYFEEAGGATGGPLAWFAPPSGRLRGLESSGKHPSFHPRPSAVSIRTTPR